MCVCARAHARAHHGVDLDYSFLYNHTQCDTHTHTHTNVRMKMCICAYVLSKTTSLCQALSRPPQSTRLHFPGSKTQKTRRTYWPPSTNHYRIQGNQCPGIVLYKDTIERENVLPNTRRVHVNDSVDASSRVFPSYLSSLSLCHQIRQH